MYSSFHALEKAAELHGRFHHPKSPDREHKSFFDVPIQPAGNLATQRLFRSGGLNASRGGDRIGVTSQRIQEVDDEQDYIGEILGTFQEPECNAFRGSSVCNPSSGNYEISIADPCCSKGCTRKHEERHAIDLGLCCWLLNENIQYRMGKREDLIQKFNDWLAGGALNWSQCNAYRVSVQCAKEEIKANNCDRSNTQCCRELKFYLSEMKKEEKAYCEMAPESKPPCPFTPSPGPK